AADIFVCRPALPDSALPVAGSRRETPAFYVHEQPCPSSRVDDEIEALDPEVAEHSPARLVHGHITESVPLQVGLERGLVGIAAVHGPSLEDEDGRWSRCGFLFFFLYPLPVSYEPH